MGLKPFTIENKRAEILTIGIQSNVNGCFRKLKGHGQININMRAIVVCVNANDRT